MLEELYAKDKLGRIKEWRVDVNSLPDGTAEYTITHGIQNCKMTSTTRRVTVGKNIGKSNETTTYEQAYSEAASRWNKQVDRGYCDEPDNIKEESEVLNFLPMLADSFDKHKSKISWPAYAQPKLDGFRALARKTDGEVTMWSRKGKVFDIPKEIIEELDSILDDDECLDGELYVHEWRSPTNEPDFQRIASAVKKYRNDTSLLQYHVYDRPTDGASFEDRFVNNPFQDSHRIKMVKTSVVNSEDEALSLYEEYIAGKLPYEGLMVRKSDSTYLFGHRSKELLKIKPSDDAEFKIIGGQEATGDDEGTVVFKCVSESGEEFDVRPTGSREVRREYWENLNKYVGQWLTVKFNGRTNSGCPRFPRGIKIRPSWDLDLSEKKSVHKVASSANGSHSVNPFKV